MKITSFRLIKNVIDVYHYYIIGNAMSPLESGHWQERQLLLQQQKKEKAELLNQHNNELASAPPDQLNVILRASILLKHSMEIIELGTRYAGLWAQLEERQKNELSSNGH